MAPLLGPLDLTSTHWHTATPPPNMTGTVEPKRSGDHAEKPALVDELEKHNVHRSEILVDANLMANAYDAEAREHEMGAWEAVRTHPMACFWAFIFCFTIVSAFSRCPCIAPKPRARRRIPANIRIGHGDF